MTNAWVVALGIACVAVVAAVFIALASRARATEAFQEDTAPVTTTYQQDGTQIVNVTIPPLGSIGKQPVEQDKTSYPEPELPSRDTLAGCEEVMSYIKDRVEDPKYQGLCPDHKCPAITLPAGDAKDFNARDTEFIYDEDGQNERRVRFMGDKIAEQIQSIERTFNYPVEDERCRFVRDKLADDANKYIFFNDNRLLTHPYSGEPEVCYIPPHVGNVAYDSDGCSKNNNRLYHPDFDDVVDKDAIRMALNQRAEGEDTYRPMCEIRFKKTATKERIGAFLQYLYNKEPEREYWQQSTSWLFNQHFEDTKTMAAYMEQLLLQQNEIQGLTSDLADCRSQNKLYIDTLRRYLIPREYMYDYLFQEGLPPNSVADEDLRRLELNLAQAAYDQKLDVTTGEFANDKTPPADIVGAGRHISRLYLAEGESEVDSARRHIMEWADYSENRRAPLTNVITDMADFSLVWDRERTAATQKGLPYDVKLGKDYDAKREKSAELPEGPLGYTHTDSCTFRDENGPDSCQSEFMLGCLFENIVDKNADANNICSWALGKDAQTKFNCSNYAALFKENGAGIDDYFGRLTAERQDKDDVVTELDGHLERKQGFHIVKDQDDNNVCVYGERGDRKCDAEFRDQCASVNVGSALNPKRVYLLNEQAGYAPTRLVKSKAREANGSTAVEIVGEVMTKVNPEDVDYVEIVDASGGNLAYVTDRTDPTAQLRAGYRDKLDKYDDLAEDLDKFKDDNAEKDQKINNLRHRLTNFGAVCNPSSAIECQKTNCSESDDFSCSQGNDQVTATLTDEAKRKLDDYDNSAGRSAQCVVPASLVNALACPTVLNGKTFTSTPALNDGWALVTTNYKERCDQKGGGNANIDSAGVYEVTGPFGNSFEANKIGDGWYKVNGDDAAPLDANNASELSGDYVEFRSQDRKFYGTAPPPPPCPAGQMCMNAPDECTKYRIGQNEQGKLQFVTASNGFNEPKPTQSYGLYKVNSDDTMKIPANADAYTLLGDVFTKRKTAECNATGGMQCGDGTGTSDNKCVANILRCETGTITSGNTCVVNTVAVCGDGTTWDDAKKQCVAVASPKPTMPTPPPSTPTQKACTYTQYTNTNDTMDNQIIQSADTLEQAKAVCDKQPSCTAISQHIQPHNRDKFIFRMSTLANVQNLSHFSPGTVLHVKNPSTCDQPIRTQPPCSYKQYDGIALSRFVVTEDIPATTLSDATKWCDAKPKCTAVLRSNNTFKASSAIHSEVNGQPQNAFTVSGGSQQLHVKLASPDCRVRPVENPCKYINIKNVRINSSATISNVTNLASAIQWCDEKPSCTGVFMDGESGTIFRPSTLDHSMDTSKKHKNVLESDNSAHEAYVKTIEYKEFATTKPSGESKVISGANTFSDAQTWCNNQPKCTAIWQTKSNGVQTFHSSEASHGLASGGQPANMTTGSAGVDTLYVKSASLKCNQLSPQTPDATQAACTYNVFEARKPTGGASIINNAKTLADATKWCNDRPTCTAVWQSKKDGSTTYKSSSADHASSGTTASTPSNTTTGDARLDTLHVKVASGTCQVTPKCDGTVKYEYIVMTGKKPAGTASTQTIMKPSHVTDELDNAKKVCDASDDCVGVSSVKLVPFGTTYSSIHNSLDLEKLDTCGVNVTCSVYQKDTTKRTCIPAEEVPPSLIELGQEYVFDWDDGNVKYTLGKTSRLNMNEDVGKRHYAHFSKDDKCLRVREVFYEDQYDFMVITPLTNGKDVGEMREPTLAWKAFFVDAGPGLGRIMFKKLGQSDVYFDANTYKTTDFKSATVFRFSKRPAPVLPPMSSRITIDKEYVFVFKKDSSEFTLGRTSRLPRYSDDGERHYLKFSNGRLMVFIRDQSNYTYLTPVGDGNKVGETTDINQAWQARYVDIYIPSPHGLIMFHKDDKTVFLDAFEYKTTTSSNATRFEFNDIIGRITFRGKTSTHTMTLTRGDHLHKIVELPHRNSAYYLEVFPPFFAFLWDLTTKEHDQRLGSVNTGGPIVAGAKPWKVLWSHSGGEVTRFGSRGYDSSDFRRNKMSNTDYVMFTDYDNSSKFSGWQATDITPA